MENGEVERKNNLSVYGKNLLERIHAAELKLNDAERVIRETVIYSGYSKDGPLEFGDAMIGIGNALKYLSKVKQIID